MKTYELTYLISPDFSEEEVRVFQKKIVSQIKDLEGDLFEEILPVRKKLAYPIKKKTFAYLATINFQLSQEKLEILEKKLKEGSGILRYLILTKRLAKEVVTPTIKLPTPAFRPATRKPKEKVELKEIEKKLEEILGET